MGILFSNPSRAAPDPQGLILNAFEAARQSMLRATALPPLQRPSR